MQLGLNLISYETIRTQLSADSENYKNFNDEIQAQGS